MKIDLSPLLNNMIKVLEIDEEINIPCDMYKNTDIRKITPLRVTGTIDDIGDRIFSIKLNTSGVMTLPCSLSLEDVEFPFNISIDSSVGEDADFEENYKIIANALDILPILWENIVLEIPSRIVKEKAKVTRKGDGWSLTNDGEQKQNNQLSELKSLLDMEGKK